MTTTPTPLQEWANANQPAETLIYKGGYWAQIIFVRDNLTSLVGAGLYWEDKKAIPSVISHHTSKSVRLPVYALSRPDLGLTIYLRYNFYDWKLSVVSATPISADFTGLFRTSGPVDPEYTGNGLASCYFEGFPEELVFGYFDEGDKCKWSAAIGGDHALWTTLFLLMRSLGAVKPAKYLTRDEHRAQLDAEAERRKQREKPGGEASRG